MTCCLTCGILCIQQRETKRQTGDSETTDNIFTANSISELTIDQVEGIEFGIIETIKLNGEMKLTGRASIVLYQVAMNMQYDGKLTREYDEEFNHIYKLA